MANKEFNARIKQKRDTSANWESRNPVVLNGEIILVDTNAGELRAKIGDGTKTYTQLPFSDEALRSLINANKITVDNALSSTSANPVQNKVVNAAINDLNTLVGDTPVSEQIEAAQIVYVGPNEPTDPNILVWVNTAEDGVGETPVMPRVSTINLLKANWTGSASPYYQTVSIDTVTVDTKVELNPTVDQIVSLQNDDIALMAENNAGVVTVYAFGGKPSDNMVMQVTLTEVSYV